MLVAPDESVASVPHELANPLGFDHEPSICVTPVRVSNRMSSPTPSLPAKNSYAQSSGRGGVELTRLIRLDVVGSVSKGHAVQPLSVTS